MKKIQILGIHQSVTEMIGNPVSFGVIVKKMNNSDIEANLEQSTSMVSVDSIIFKMTF